MLRRREQLAETIGKTWVPEESELYPTPGYITMEEPIRYMRERFRDLHQEHPEQRDTLRALMLLSAAGVLPVTHDHLRAILEHIFERPPFHLGDCLEVLANLAFLRSGSQDPVEPEPAYLRDAVTYTPGRDPEEDFPKLADVLENQLEDHNGLMYLGNTYATDLNDNEQALVCFERALRLKPDSPRIWVNKGWALDKLGDYAGELKALNEALRLKIDLPEAWNNKAMTLGELDAYEGALEALEEALRLDPNNFNVWTEKASVLREFEDFRGEVEALEEALRLKPDYFVAWNNLGVALSDLGDLEGALAAYEEALRLKPDFAASWHGKGMILADLGRYNEAVNWLCKAWHAFEQHADVRNVVAKKLGELGHGPQECEKG